MLLEIIVTVIVFVVGHFSFRNFQGQTPRARTVRKWVVYIMLVVILTLTVGRPLSLVWAFAPVIGSLFHFGWCFYHGIHPLTAEPRAKYYALRGWKVTDETASQ